MRDWILEFSIMFGFGLLITAAIFFTVIEMPIQDETNIIKCYDRWDNEMIGQKCEENIKAVFDNESERLLFSMFITLFFFFCSFLMSWNMSRKREALYA